MCIGLGGRKMFDSLCGAGLSPHPPRLWKSLAASNWLQSMTWGEWTIPCSFPQISGKGLFCFMPCVWGQQETFTTVDQSHGLMWHKKVPSPHSGIWWKGQVLHSFPARLGRRSNSKRNFYCFWESLTPMQSKMLTPPFSQILCFS